jgi:uroporphyrinogen III methyltransferase/synthase
MRNVPHPGFVTLAGAGPGDPDLITAGGLRALQAADVVVHDALLSSRLLDFAPAGAERIDAGKRAGAHSMSQDEINAILIAKARQGKRVVRLKGGDPFVFGRGGEEALALRAAGIPFSVVPGVSSAVAVPAYAGIPVTHRGLARSFAVITGSESNADAHDWSALARIDTLVVLMGAAALGDTAAKLIAAGRDPRTPAASIANGTLPSQASVIATLETIAGAVREAGLPTPLLTVIGAVAALGAEIGWRAAPPLAGKSVVVTRTRAQASQLRAALEALGASVLEAPVLEIRFAAPDLTTDDRAAARWDWVVFASQNAVTGLFRALRAAGRDVRTLGATKLAAVGDATAEALDAHGLLADFVPSQADAEHLAAELPRVDGARVLIPSGSLSDQRLGDGLRARGAHVERVQVYETLPATLDDGTVDALLHADAITFASASSATFLASALGERVLPGTTKLCAIGPRAAEAARNAFGRVDAVAGAPSIEGLAAAVVEALS